MQWSEAARQKIATRIAVLFRPSLLGAHRWSLVVMDERGRVLFADAPSRAVAPASAQKIIVAETALRVLGPSFRFPTLLVARSPVGASKHIATLWVVGSGDPSLRARDLRDSARALRRIGVRSIGRIAVDPTASRSAELNPHWNPRNDGAPYQAPTSAISVDGNLFDSTPVVHPNRVAGEILRKALQHVGIRVRSAVVISPAPLLGSVLWEHYSAPLTTLERHMLVQSDNHYAEQLLQAVALRSDERADNAAGFRAERAMLRTLHVPTPGLHLLDGSGLSHGNRIAAITLATLLLRTRGRGAYDMEPLLARAGLDGTLQGIDFGAASGRVRAKTGHLDDASSLEGFVRTRHHGEVIFAFEVNGSPGDPDAAMRRAVAALSLM
ncbi:MAG TPA: D-alanyl-D-alanine carboxypeptidase/D-alanyl-D-alanine-endopeptidase [Candidatus Dormibacteraeota bacterium]|nr:D-alanyl-D-alanine carboxypeptidase/D-alanyl-D-alanine-endopeptidase [Candidatus Dormibacteraeota bacterium]